MQPKPVAKRFYRRYNVRNIRVYLRLFDAMPPCSSEREFCRQLRLPQSSFARWKKNRHQYDSSTNRGSRATLLGRGKTESVAFADELLQSMEDVRNEESFLTTTSMATWLLTNKHEWTTMFGDEGSDESHKRLLEWCRRFAYRHGFSYRAPVRAKRLQSDLEETRQSFATSFWAEHSGVSLGDIINADETPVYYDMPPTKTLSKRGDSARVKEAQKHSERVSVLLSIRADGGKLPPLIIVKGTPGGTIDCDELPTYPPGAVYAVQEHAYMDHDVWAIYLREILKFEVQGPTVLVVDNLHAHVSDRAKTIMEVELNCSATLAQLPANSTSFVQPLDVGIMGPFKSMCRKEWLYEERVQTAAEKRLKLIQRVIKVWGMVSSSMIVRSFEKALPNVVEL
ncbi:hypothetical protein AaE_014591 [Aphanomyces astaci]|uniref:DDE-1 domain-containing protein n=1 Tax=Aphanomyces astaci TaxID=112090 RepID=A0A6A4Z503_APHAT|nr:hypothetical protein AaE_014591 [Aphanomyces astaci]